MTGINILGTGICVPEKIVTNDDLAAMVETNDEWIKSRTGISERRVSTGEPSWFLAKEAALHAIKESGVSAEEIDAIIVSTVTSDFFTPSMACMVQRETGAVNAFAFDVNAACSGFVYALDIAHKYLSCGTSKNILLVACESLTKITDFNDRSTCILFGDGAAAMVITADTEKSYMGYLGADGNGGTYLYAKHPELTSPFYKKEKVAEYDDKLGEPNGNYLVQNGKEVYKFATRILPKAVNEVLKRANLTIDDVDFFVPHQANLRIIETAASLLGVSMDKFIVTLDKYGNTSSSSMPIAFNDAVNSGKIKRGDKVCFVGFGAGLTYGACIIEY